MKKVLVSAAAVMLLFGSAIGSRAQMEGGKPVGAALNGPVDPAKSSDQQLTNLENEIVAAARAMPAAKYSFSPASLNIPGAKFEGVRTFAAEVKHVSQVNYGLFSAVSGQEPTIDVRAIGSLTDKDQIVAALQASFVYAHQAVATLTIANENDPVPGDGRSRGFFAAYAVQHGFDHYGQMVEYLRMNGIVPPASAK